MSNTEAISFTGGDASGIDPLSGAGRLINALVDEAGSMRARPAVSSWSGFPSSSVTDTSAVTGLIPAFGALIYTTANKNIFAVRNGLLLDLSAGDATRQLAGSGRPSFALGRKLLVIANGGVPQKVDDGFISSRLGGSPPAFNDILFCAQRLVGSGADTSGLFYWSDTGETGFETWDPGVEFREAESRPDALVALRESVREIFAFGTQTTQVFSPDATETFTPTSTIDVGALAAASVVPYDGGQFLWLDDKRRFVISNARDLSKDNILSSPFITASLEQLTTVSDCWGYRQRIGANDLVAWVFPTEGRAFCIDLTTRKWTEFFGYTSGNWSPYPITAYTYWADNNLHLVGRSDGTIGQINFDARTDDGNVLKCLARTGFGDYGMANPKDPIEAQFLFRRGEASSSTSAVDVSWRDDLGAFRRPISKALGVAGSYDPVAVVRPAGAPFVTRQWEVAWSASDAVLFAGAKLKFNEVEY